jgi:hypothetical protein
VSEEKILICKKGEFEGLPLKKNFSYIFMPVCAAQPLSVKKGEFEGAAPQEKLLHMFMPVCAMQALRMIGL